MNRTEIVTEITCAIIQSGVVSSTEEECRRVVSRASNIANLILEDENNAIAKEETDTIDSAMEANRVNPPQRYTPDTNFTEED